MQVRQATADDGETLRSIASDSMEASYSLSPGTIQSAVATWYDDDALAEKLDDDDHLLLVAESGGDAVGFSESELVEEFGDILWLHVDPMYRGEDVGQRLYRRTKSALQERGAESIRGRVLADNSEGNAFYEHQGMHKTGQSTVDIDGTDYVENVYVDHEPAELEIVAENGRDLYVDKEITDRGSKGPFLTVYSDRARETKWGFFCSNCESLVTSMDSMGRMECNSCGNTRKPTRWDAAHM